VRIILVLVFQTSKNKKIHGIHSTVQVIRAFYVHHVVGTGRYPTSTTNMYDDKDFTYLIKSNMEKSEHLIVLVMSVKHTRKR